MSADIELLRLAAKAYMAGIRWDVSKHIPLDAAGVPLAWNPLEDDGDALRLAVKLELCITQWPNHSQYPPHVMIGYRAGPKSGTNWIQEYEDDEMAANRRAIVCAAAEIGRAMP